jgi:hypothetical protein
MRVNKVVEPDTAPKSPTIDRHCVTLFCVTQIIVTLATAGRVYEGGGIRVERKKRYVRVDVEWV